MPHGILLHEPDDDVGVAVADLKAGAEVGAVTLEGKFIAHVKLVNDVPLGHKVAMKDILQGKDVIEYGRVIGMASQAAPRGSHVHTHNLKTKRWKV
jgi:(2R)-sulfolactate sulfo-lyase subunit alpha